MEYIEKVEALTGLMLEAEENYEIVKIIGDADLIYDVAIELQDALGKRFYYECETDDFDYLLEHADILSISTSRDENGILYFLSEVIYDGVTLESEADTFYIHENVFDALDTDRLFGEIVLLKEYDESCEDNVENELEETFEEIVDDAMSEIDGCVENNEEFCLHCIIKDSVKAGYLEGYRKAQEMLRNALNENLHNI
jgi:hypothetical protein